MAARRGLSVALSGIVISVGAWLAAPAPPPATPTPPGYDQEPQAFFPSSVSFPDRRHGWAFNARCNHAMWCTNELWATRDGGDTWAVAPAPAGKWYEERRTTDPTTNSIVSVAFADERNGWLFDPSLYVTHDGGRSWAHEVHEGAISDLTAQDDWAWALEHARCPEGTSCTPASTVLRGRATGRLLPLKHQPAGVEGASELIGAGPDRAYLVVATDDIYAFDVLVTEDGGTTWRRSRVGCRGDVAHVRALSTEHLWVACPRVHMASVHAQSFDGGRTWEAAPPVATRSFASGPVPAGDGALLYEKGDGQGLRLSTDGGQTDTIVFASKASEGGRRFIEGFVRADPDHLWLVTVALEPPGPGVDRGLIVWAPYSLLRSDDGGRSWRIVHVT